MNTQQVADRLVDLCRRGEGLTAINELYDDNVVSKEMPGMPSEVTSGIKSVFAKTEEWVNNIQEMHSGSVSDPQIAGNHFSCIMDFDVTFKDRGRQQMQEVCVYEVNNGKIVNEQFFYSM